MQDIILQDARNSLDSQVNRLCNKASDTLVYDHTSCKVLSYKPEDHLNHTSCRPEIGGHGYQHARMDDYHAIIKEVKDFIRTLDLSKPEHANALERVIGSTELKIPQGTPQERRERVLNYDFAMLLKQKEGVVVEYKADLEVRTKEMQVASQKKLMKEKASDIFMAGIEAVDKNPNLAGYLINQYEKTFNAKSPADIPSVETLRQQYEAHSVTLKETVAQPVGKEWEQPKYSAWSDPAIQALIGVLLGMGFLGYLIIRKPKQRASK